MARNIIGIVVGYVSMALFVFITFTILYLILGADGAFEPGSYQVSSTWVSIINPIIGAVCVYLGASFRKESQS